MADRLSLTELQFIIRDSLYMSLPDMYWVTAEISEINENYAGHCYIELIEKQADEKNIRSRARAIIWSKRYRFLKSFFENVTGQTLRSGLKILIRVKVEYHEIYGLSLIINDIDPAFTIGDMAMRRQAIIKQLEQDGVFTMNKELGVPLVPQRIAIISSRNAAGYSDFMNHLTGNSYGFVFYTSLFESAMQGEETEYGIIKSLDRIAEKYSYFDVVVIIRGGGSQTDLSWFDNYNIAYHITQFPLPVVTGIGHEKDLSVTDMVACLALKTPTAVADYIIDSIIQFDSHLTEIGSEIRNLAQLTIDKYRNIVDSSGMRLLPMSKIMISQIRDKLSEKIINIINIGKHFLYQASITPASQGSRLNHSARSFIEKRKSITDRNCYSLKNITIADIDRKKSKMSSLENTLSILKPENVLLRGYTITSLGGKILKRSDQVKSDDIIETRFSKGKIESIVSKRKDKDKN